SCRFTASPETPAARVLDRMASEGPWYALGDGETFEDMIFNTLIAGGSIRCSECGEAVSVTEESLGQLALEGLGCWEATRSRARRGPGSRPGPVPFAPPRAVTPPRARRRWPGAAVPAPPGRRPTGRRSG